MADGLTDDGIVVTAMEGRSRAPGLSAIAIGLLALAIAVVECVVSVDISDLGLGTIAYIAGYAAAGVVLIAIGIWKLYGR